MLTIAQMLALTHLAKPLQNERGAMLGLAFNLLVEHPTMASRCLDWHYQRLVRAIELRQLTFYFDRFGRNCGYVWWTRVPSAPESDMLKFGPDVLSADRLSGEGKAWILDFRAGFGELPNILVALHDMLPSDCDTLAYFRYKRGRRIAKRISLHGKVTLFKRPSRVGHVDEAAWLQSEQGKSMLSSAKAGLERSIHCGLILELFARLPRYADMPLLTVLGRIRHALGTRQCHLLRAPNGVPLAFYSWLWRESAELISAVPLHELEQSEWRDGRDALVGDAVATREGIEALRNEISAFAQGLSWIYPEHGTVARPLISSSRCLSLTALDAEVCDFTVLGSTHAEASACEI